MVGGRPESHDARLVRAISKMRTGDSHPATIGQMCQEVPLGVLFCFDANHNVRNVKTNVGRQEQRGHDQQHAPEEDEKRDSNNEDTRYGAEKRHEQTKDCQHS